MQQGKARDEIFLAIYYPIYYSRHGKESVKTVRFFCTLLIFIFSFNTFQSSVNAGQIEKAAQDYRQQAYEEQEKGNLNEALALYTKAESLGAGGADFFNDVGVVYEQLGMTEKAETSYLKAIQEDKGFLPAYTNLGYLYKNEGDFARAAEFFKQRAEWGSPGDAWTVRSQEELDALSEKVPSLRAYLLRRKAADLTREVNQKKQEEFYRKVALAKKHFTMAQEYEKKERFSRAIDEYTRALSLMPENPKLIQARKKAELEWTKRKVKQHTEYALRWLELGDTLSAKLEFRKILSIIPDEPIFLSEQ